jgi:hypothetical protein
VSRVPSTRARPANEHEFAPPFPDDDRFEIDGHCRKDLVAAREPCLVSWSLFIRHGRERVERVRHRACKRSLRDEMHYPKKGSQPRFDDDDAAVGFEDTSHFGECRAHIIKVRQMMEPALDDRDVARGGSKWQPARIADDRRPVGIGGRDERHREIETVHVAESKLPPRDQSAAAAGTDLQDARPPIPSVRPKTAKAPKKLSALLLRRLEPLVRDLPRRGLSHGRRMESEVGRSTGISWR